MFCLKHEQQAPCVNTTPESAVGSCTEVSMVREWSNFGDDEFLHQATRVFTHQDTDADQF